MTTLAFAAEIGARCALVAMFPLSAFDKVVNWRAALAQTRGGGLPGAVPMLVAAILVEAVTPVMIVTGLADRLGAVLLAGFCVVTAFLYHPFWRWPRFWQPGAEGNEHYWQFFKNWCIVGGLMLVVLSDGGRVSPLVLLHAPLASSLWR